MARSDLMHAWRQWEPARPFLLDGDRERFNSSRSRAACVEYSSWTQAYRASDFGVLDDTRVHLGLLPHPFCGNLEHASIFVLMLNPGFGPWDCYGEYEVPEYRRALLTNLRQEFSGSSVPFLFLDPQFSWHGGYTWWYGRFARVIETLANRWRVSVEEAREALAYEIASIELFPYHSASFRDADGWLSKRRTLPSVELARLYVNEVVLPRVRRGEAIAIVTRRVKTWAVASTPNVIQYSAGQARGAHLTPTSTGGRAILALLENTELGDGRVLGVGAR